MQPLVCAVFSALKSSLLSITADLVLLRDDKLQDQGDLFSVMRDAYERSFTDVKIQAGLQKAGLFPLHHTCLTSQPRSASHAADAPILSVEEMEQMVNTRRGEIQAEALGEDAVMCRSGWVDTSHGCVTTSQKFMSIVREKAKDDAKREQIRRQSDFAVSTVLQRLQGLRMPR